MARNFKRLDRRCLITVLVKGKDADGGPTTAYQPIGPEKYCHREDRGGREARGADALRSEADAIFTLRWFAGLTTQHRIVCEGREYSIVAPPSEEGRRDFWTVQARENPAA